MIENNNEIRYYFGCRMIQSFKCSDTERLFRGIPVKRWESLERVALRKLEWVNAARDLSDLRIPPGNRLEKLSGNREGRYNIRINDQWRVCFEWHKGNAWEVEIVDYH